MPYQLIDKAIEQLARQWSCSIDNFKLIHRHVDKAAYSAIYPDGNRVIVKMDLRIARHRNELLMLGLAKSYELPIPQVIFADDGEFGVTVLTWLPGEPLSLDDELGCVNTGALLRKLHSIPATARIRPFSRSDGTWSSLCARYTDEVRIFAEFGLMNSSMTERLREILIGAFANSREPQMTMIHGDFQELHVLLNPSTKEVSGLLDLADSGLGDPLWDIAVLTSRSISCTKDVLHGYDADDALMERASKIIPAYRVVRWMGEVRWRLLQKNDISFQIAQLTAAARDESKEHQCTLA